MLPRRLPWRQISRNLQVVLGLLGFGGFAVSRWEGGRGGERGTAAEVEWDGSRAKSK